MSGGWGMGWFGGGAAAKKDAPKNAILGLRSTLDMLTKREKHLQNQMDEQDALARKNVNTNKTAAKAALRRKKQFEHSLEQTSQQMMRLEQEISAIESANINKETMDAMRQAGVALKKIHGTLTVDKVDQAMEELRDQHEISKEISNAMSMGLEQDPADEEDLENELEELQQQELENTMLNPVPQDALQRLPTPAGGELKGKAPRVEEDDDEEEELRRLQAEMVVMH